VRAWVHITVLLLMAACSESAVHDESADSRPTAAAANIEAALSDGIDHAIALADSIDRLLQPEPLLTPAQETALRRHGNDQQLARARQLGVRPADSAHIARLTAEGTLVRLQDSTELWAVRRLEHSQPYVTPDVVVLLERIGTRFHDQLTRRGLPRYRLEITSVLRTPEAQADLRRTNINAAAGASTHEYATTLDIAYSSFAAPATVPAATPADAPAWLQSQLERVTAAILETAAARKSRELQAILGIVLLEMQSAGDVMVTLERQQPVYHLTVARRLR
jgi:hypothetical protein